MRNTGIQVRLFNSHPHKEDDKENQAILFYNCFSTHILTRRMTVHDDTSLGVLQFFNSHPHKEDDGCWRRKRNSSEVFNSHPHKEDDLLPDHKYQHCDFSTHILTRRMTHFVANNL